MELPESHPKTYHLLLHSTNELCCSVDYSIPLLYNSTGSISFPYISETRGEGKWTEKEDEEGKHSRTLERASGNADCRKRPLREIYELWVSVEWVNLISASIQTRSRSIITRDKFVPFSPNSAVSDRSNKTPKRRIGSFGALSIAVEFPESFARLWLPPFGCRHAIFFDDCSTLTYCGLSLALVSSIMGSIPSDGGSSLVRASIALSVLQIVFVAARFYTRYWRRTRCGADDYVILIALVCTCALAVKRHPIC